MGAGVSASFGGAGALTTAQFAGLQSPNTFGEVSGCAVTTGAGTREVIVAAGTVRLPGTSHTVSGITLNLPENTSGQPRRDSIVLVYDWNANSSSVTYRSGTPAASPQAPALDRLAGDLWMVELAEVPVAAGQTTLSSAWDRRPGMWLELSPLSPWSNYGSNRRGLAWRIRTDGDIELRGMVLTTSTITSPVSQPIVTLPPRYRPEKVETFIGSARDGSLTSSEQGRIDVDAAGRVFVAYPESTTGTRWYSLSNIRWTPSILEA